MSTRSASSVRRVMSLQDAAVQLLDGAIGSLRRGIDEQSVHTARSACKRLRAALRLLREGFGNHAYRSENRRVRDSARPLTDVRDVVVLRQTLRKLSKNSQPLARNLEADYHRAWRALEERGAKAALVHLKVARRQLAKVAHVDSEIASAITGAKDVYRAGRKALGKARSCDDQALHEWRKQAKYLANQLDLLRIVFNARFRKLHRRAKQLAEVLGEDHDLSILLGKLPSRGSDEHALRNQIGKRRRKLQARAFWLGKRLYRHSARRVEASLVAHLSDGQRTGDWAKGGQSNGH